MEEGQVPLAPISGFSTAPISAYGAVMLRFQYLTHPTQALEEAHTSPSYVLLAAQARELIQQIERALARLESGPPQGTGLPRH